MTYEKPELTQVGDAVRVIEGSKVISGENGALRVPADCEFGD